MRISLARVRASQSKLRFLAVKISAFLAVSFCSQNAFAAPRDAVVQSTAPNERLLMAHYLPWFQNKTIGGSWGWHWTMNHFDPEKTTPLFNLELASGEAVRREAASRFYPLVGLYDSGDPDTLRYQVMLMKISGIDGVVFDWYGTENFYDYALLNRNTLRLIPYLEQAGMRFAICYEDQSVHHQIEAKHFPATEAVPRGKKLMEWMQTNFFAHPSYLQIDGRPVLLSFGEPFFDDAAWNELFSVLPAKPLFFTENVIRDKAKTAAIGGYDWPAPVGGDAGALHEQNAFYERAAKWPLFIAAAFPRFQDMYALAGAGRSWGTISDREGACYTDSLSRALQSRAAIVQLVTWNDWGEGTQIEPSVEFGFRDLEATQKLRTQYLDPKFSHNASDLRLPVKWYRLKKSNAANKSISEQLDRVFPMIATNRMRDARALLSKWK